MSYDFLRPDEEVLYSIRFKNGLWVATNRRVVIQQRDDQDVTDDFDYRYLAHISLHYKDLTGSAVIALAAGLLLFIMGIFVNESSLTAALILLGIILVIIGILRWRKYGIITLSVPGIAKQFTYRASGDKKIFEKFIASIRKARGENYSQQVHQGAEPTPKPVSSICPSCGSANPAGLRYCGQCGHMIANQTAENVSSKPPTPQTAVQSFQPLTVVICSTCGFKVQRAPNKDDYINKEVGHCSQCNGIMRVKSIGAVDVKAAVPQPEKGTDSHEAASRPEVTPILNSSDTKSSKFCPSCGKRIEPSAHYCDKCGHALT